MDSENHGIKIAPPKPRDFVLGGAREVKPIETGIRWKEYLPSFEKQYSKKSDFLICATMSGIDHSVVTHLNYLLKTSKLTDEALNFFKRYKFIINGEFSLSSRYNAKLNGTEVIKGNYLNDVAESARHVGFVSETLWPTTEDMTWEEFYSDVPEWLMSIGEKALWFIDPKYQWIPPDQLAAALELGPVQMAIQVCPGYHKKNKTIKKCDGKPFSHAVMGYEKKTTKWLIRDHYIPFDKAFAKDYNLPYNLQYFVFPKHVLRNGMNGKNCLKLQQDLFNLGYTIKVDSFFGIETEDAVRKFQAKYHLGADGRAGEKTLAKIAELLK